jgi:hypothetical protein
MRGCPGELAECDAMLHYGQRLTEVSVTKLSTNSVTKRDIGHVLRRVHWSRAFLELQLPYGRKGTTGFQSKCVSINDSKKYSLQPF